MHLVELIQDHYEFRNHATKPNEILLNCPFCMDNGHAVEDTNFKLGLNILEEKAHCHRCDWKAVGERLFYALAEEVNINETYESDINKDTELQKKKRTKFSLKKVKLPKEFEPLWKDVNEREGRKALAYLTARNITEEQIRRHHIGFCAVGRYRKRIILPISYKEHLVSFTSRAYIDGLEPKYLISDGEKFFYNYPAKKRDRCIILEGPFDVLNVERAIKGWDILGTQGCALTELHIHVLKNYKQIAIWPDPDNAGITGAEKIAELLKDNTSAKIMGIPILKDQRDDPGGLSAKLCRRAVAQRMLWGPDYLRKAHLRISFTV